MRPFTLGRAHARARCRTAPAAGCRDARGSGERNALAERLTLDCLVHLGGLVALIELGDRGP